MTDDFERLIWRNLSYFSQQRRRRFDSYC